MSDPICADAHVYADRILVLRHGVVTQEIALPEGRGLGWRALEGPAGQALTAAGWCWSNWHRPRTADALLTAFVWKDPGRG